ncbi:DUF488 domain-containing protein [candidate division FCPU426 bacterium]|nr:DUF488 domain-containing protein [candidate division FCPU426 bacterium]
MVESGKKNKGIVYTIGHSDLVYEVFVNILRQAGVQILVDIRTAPHSKHVPHFDQAVLKEKLPASGITYHHIKELGGKGRKPLRRSPNKGLPKAWQAYADHMLTEEFERGLMRLLALASIGTVAVLCAEAKWERCHRKFLADAVMVRGMRVIHLAADQNTAHALTPGLEIQKEKLLYPALGEQLTLFSR